MAKARRNQPSYTGTVDVEANGQWYSGTYTVQGGWVTVTSPHGTKSGEARNTPTDTYARRLLFEMVADFREPARTEREEPDQQER